MSNTSTKASSRPSAGATEVATFAAGRLWLAVLVALAFGACSGGPPRRQYATEGEARRADPAMVAAEDLANAGRKDDARRAFAAIRRADPTNIDAFRREAALTLEAGEPADQRALAEELTGLAETAPTSRAKADFLALSAFMNRNDVAREEALREALHVDDGSSLANLLLAELLERRGDDDQALPLLRAAVSTNDVVPAAERRLAFQLIRIRDYDGAIDRFKSYVLKADGDAVAHYNLGTLLLSEGDDKNGAWRHLSRAMALAPEDGHILVNAAAAAMAVGEGAAALDILTRAKRFAPDDPETFYNLAHYYADFAKDPRAAVVNFETYLSLGGPEKLRVNKWIQELRKQYEK